MLLLIVVSQGDAFCLLNPTHFPHSQFQTLETCGSCPVEPNLEVSVVLKVTLPRNSWKLFGTFLRRKCRTTKSVPLGRSWKLKSRSGRSSLEPPKYQFGDASVVRLLLSRFGTALFLLHGADSVKPGAPARSIGSQLPTRTSFKFNAGKKHLMILRNPPPLLGLERNKKNTKKESNLTRTKRRRKNGQTILRKREKTKK